MIKHIVCMKLKDKAEATKIKEMLESLVDLIPPLLTMEVGLDYLQSERSYDMALIATYKTREDLETYRVHPEHKKVQAYIHAVRESSVSVDFEF